MSAIVKVIASTFPSICVAMGALLLFGGQTSEGGGLIAVGTVFQGLYLLARYKS